MKQMKATLRYLFQWYHREEWQVVLVLIGVVIFFSRTIWISIGVSLGVLLVVVVLYLLRLFELYCTEKKKFMSFVEQYQRIKNVLHVHSVERSRIAMGLLASVVLLVLTLHRIDLALAHPADATPTDLYWIVFLGWYTLLATVTTAYLIWLWRNWVRYQSVRIPLMDGLVASMFFYHGLKRHERILTYVAAFFLGGIPSYFALRLTPETPYGYTIAILLVIPVVIFTIGGAVYARHYLARRTEEKNVHTSQ
ncbi:MAG: hypothetical protein N3A63_09005 [Bacteroidetes bacterium]|nr:hypothetical protein [Bacteroidota bacterium]